MGVATFQRLRRRRVAMKTSAASVVEAMAAPPVVALGLDGASLSDIDEATLEQATAPAPRKPVKK